MKNFYLSLSTLLLSTIITAQQIDKSNWELVSTPTQQNLTEIEIISAEVAYAIGNAGTILRTNNNGYSWLLMNSPSTRQLRSISFISDSVGFVSDSGSVYKTTDAGQNWITVYTGNVRKIQFSSLNQGYMITDSEENKTKLFSITNNGLQFTFLSLQPSI